MFFGLATSSINQPTVLSVPKLLTLFINCKTFNNCVINHKSVNYYDCDLLQIGLQHCTVILCLDYTKYNK